MAASGVTQHAAGESKTSAGYYEVGWHRGVLPVRRRQRGGAPCGGPKLGGSGKRIAEDGRDRRAGLRIAHEHFAVNTL